MTESHQIKIQFHFTCIYLIKLLKHKFHIHILSNGGFSWCFGMVKSVKNTHQQKRIQVYNWSFYCQSKLQTMHYTLW